MNLPQEIVVMLTDLYDIDPNDFLFGIRYKHYPLLSWIWGGDFLGKLSHFNATNYGKWLIRVKLIVKHNILGNNRVELAQKSFSVLLYTAQEDWTIIDIQQAGKYMLQSYLCTYYVIIFR